MLKSVGGRNFQDDAFVSYFLSETWDFVCVESNRGDDH